MTVSHTMEELLLIVALAAVSVITVFANLLVIAAFCIDKRLRKTNNYFVVSLTIAGFLTGGYSIPLYCVTKWTKSEPLPSICQVCGFLDNALATISVWTLAMTSLDRYYMVINYKRYKQVVTSSRAKLVLVFVWFYGFLVCAPPLVGWNEYHFSNVSATCGMKHFAGEEPDKEYFLFYFFTSFPFPLAIVTFCYTRIFIQAWGVYRRRERRISAAQNRTENNKKLSSFDPKPVKNGSFLIAHTKCNGGSPTGRPLARPLEPLNTNSVSNTNATSVSNTNDTSRFSRAFSRKNSHVGGMNINKTVRATLMVFVLVLTNVVCTFPIFVFSLIIYWDNYVYNRIPGEIYTFFIFLFFLNSALNPIMYGLFNTNFRGTFNRLIRCEFVETIRQNGARYTKLVGRLTVSRNPIPSTFHPKNEAAASTYSTTNSPIKSVAVQTPEGGVGGKKARTVIRIQIVNLGSSPST